MGMTVLSDILNAVRPILEWFSAQSDYGNGVSNIVNILAVTCSVVVGVVFMWWGVRKVISMVTSAFRSGRISL